MRLSHVLVGGTVVAAAVAAGSAFTASNALENNTVAGFDDATVTGATVTNIKYNPDTDVELLASVEFTATGDITDTASTMKLELANAAVAGSASTCADVLDTGNTVITCTLTAPVAFVAFDEVGLTVVSQ